MAHIATVANDSIYPGNEYDEIHNGLLGAKNLPGIAVYHANVFYHLLLAQARDPIANWREIDENLLAEGKIIGIEAYLVNPLQTLVLWMLEIETTLTSQVLTAIRTLPGSNLQKDSRLLNQWLMKEQRPK